MSIVTLPLPSLAGSVMMYNHPPAMGGGMMKTLMLGAALLAAMVATCVASDRVERRYSPAVEQFTYSWVAMPLLPRRLQNHCGYYNGHFICADHCGLEY